MFDLKNAKRIAVGTSETIKAIRREETDKIYIADDANDYIRGKVMKAIDESGRHVEVVCVGQMKKLGNDCHISRPAACAAIIK